MDLTREEAIFLFREHWSDLAYTTDHSPADKEWFIREREHKVRFNCYLCEYGKYYIGDYESCNTKCPIEWPKTTDSIKGTPCQRSYYGDWTSHKGEWMSCEDEEKIRELARLISQLPEKEKVKITIDEIAAWKGVEPDNIEIIDII